MKIRKPHKITSKRVSRELRVHPNTVMALIPILLTHINLWSEDRRHLLLAHLIQSGAFDFKNGELDGLSPHLRFLWALLSAHLGPEVFRGSHLYEYLIAKRFDLVANYLVTTPFVRSFEVLFSPLVQHYRNHETQE